MTVDVIEVGLWIVASFVGSFIAIVVVLHYDIEGWWEQRRLQHGKQLDQRQREAAEKHGKRGS
jgi:hypothetical protein